MPRREPPTLARGARVLPIYPLFFALLLFCESCATPAQSTPNPTVEALSTQVGALQQRLATLQPDAPTPRPSTPSNVGGSSESEAEVIEAASVPAAEEPTPEPAVSANPTATSRPTLVPTRTPRVITEADAAPCELGQIKGNRNSRIYHVPGGGSYSQTRQSVVCFNGEAEAEAAGYRRARN